MKKVVAIFTVVGWVTLSLCGVMNFGGMSAESQAMEMEHGSGHGDMKHGVSEMSMGCCAVVSGGAITPEQTFTALFLASVAFLMVYNFFIPSQLYLHLFRPPRSITLFQ